MGAHLAKIVLMVVMSHGFRTLGRISSLRLAGLALGLPCSTAVALVGGGLDRGVDYAVLMSGTSLIGLAGAVALPMAYARAVARGWRLHRAILLGVASYLFIVLAVGRMLPGRGDASLGVALLAVAAASVVAGRMRVGEEVETPGGMPLSPTLAQAASHARPDRLPARIARAGRGVWSRGGGIDEHISCRDLDRALPHPSGMRPFVSHPDGPGAAEREPGDGRLPGRVSVRLSMLRARLGHLPGLLRVPVDPGPAGLFRPPPSLDHPENRAARSNAKGDAILLAEGLPAVLATG